MPDSLRNLILEGPHGVTHPEEVLLEEVLTRAISHLRTQLLAGPKKKTN